MTWRGISTLAIAATVLPTVLSTQTVVSKHPSIQTNEASSPFTGDFNEHVESLMDEWKLAGMAVAVIDGDQVFTEAYGYSNLPDTKATPDTLWYVGSTTKVQLAATLSHLIHTEEHAALKNGWSTRISSLIRDDFVLQDEWATEHLTLEDAVSHRTGLPSHDIALARYPNSSTPIKDAVRNLRNVPMQLEARVEWHYCNPMWQVLTHVVETLTGKLLHETLKKIIWDPLNMKSTFIDADDAKQSGLDISTGYWYDEKNGTYVAMPFMPTAEVSGAGAILSTVTDYAKWVQALLKSSDFVSKAVHADLVRPRFIAMPEPNKGADVTTYTLGWFRTTLHGERTIWHSGSTSTHGALVYWLPETQYGVVIFQNYPTVVREAVIYKLIEDKLGIAQEKRIDVNGLAKTAIKQLKQDFANATNVLYPDRPSVKLPPSVALSSLAGTYRHKGYGTLKLTVEEHPGKADEKILVADRPDFVWAQHVTLEHASRDFWTALWRFRDNNPAFGEYFRAKFVVGSNGKVKGLEVTFQAGADGFLDGVVFFGRD